jgi:hypothetical protein
MAQKKVQHRDAATGNAIAGAVLGGLALIAFGVGLYIYYKNIRKGSNKPMAKMSEDLGDEDDTL